MYFFETHVPIVYEVEVEDFFFIMKISNDASILTEMVFGVVILLSKVSFGEILGVHIVGIRSV